MKANNGMGFYEGVKKGIVQSLCLTLVAFLSHGQGTFVYDQQSADESTSGGAAGQIQGSQPLGQSFTPTLSSVGFIRLALGDSSINGLGATVYVLLRSNSITGPILASTEPVFMPDGFSGFPDFIFSTPLSVTPETTYFFQPVTEPDSDIWGIVGYSYGYDRGSAYYSGVQGSGDLWFREGIIVPEPSAALLFLLGGSTIVWLRRVSFSRFYGFCLFVALRPGRGV